MHHKHKQVSLPANQVEVVLKAENLSCVAM